MLLYANSFGACVVNLLALVLAISPPLDAYRLERARLANQRSLVHEQITGMTHHRWRVCTIWTKRRTLVSARWWPSATKSTGLRVRCTRKLLQLDALYACASATKRVRVRTRPRGLHQADATGRRPAAGRAAAQLVSNNKHTKWRSHLRTTKMILTSRHISCIFDGPE